MNLDNLTEINIKNYLSTDFIGQNIIYFDKIDSTNFYAKSVGESCKDGTVVTSEFQTNGRGRLGRQWESQNGSISMSIVLKPENISMFQAAKITQVCAASVLLALNEFNIEVNIKWPNDLMINSKKICGILTEMKSENNKVVYVVVGIGVNVNNKSDEFIDEIKNTAGSIYSETDKIINKAMLAAKILNNFEKLYEEFLKGNFKKSLDICREKSNVIGRNVNLINKNETIKAKALNIGDEGELIVQYEDGMTDSIISGEISVRTV